ncbi:uncharacterized protein LOC143920104 [Arctopsyche grandis]|uniref:uncharacterized protein LOC143920104 n=1 Tax=Arctopsyche grandis TaxID=121162 RepID=UPI00406D7DDA
MTVERIHDTGEKATVNDHTNRPTVDLGAMSLASSVGDSAPGTESSPPAPPLTPHTSHPARNWSESLLNWVNCVLGTDTFHSLSYKALFALIKCFDGIKDDADDDTYLERSIVLFLKREYPYFRRGKHIDVSEDTTLIASLLLHYSCVKSKDVAIRGTMCQQLDTIDQKAILIFANNLMKHENITERNLQNAIAAISTDVERLELSYNEKASSTPLRIKMNVMNSPLIKSPLLVGTPSSLRSRKVFHLEAELGAERFDRNFLQEEVDRQSQRIVELERLQDTYREEVQRLRRELNLVGDCDEDDKVENCNQCKHKDKMLEEELRSHELEILRLLSNIQNVEEERDSLITRLTESEHAVSVWSSQAIESESMRDVLKTQLEAAQSEMCDLKTALLDANRYLEEYRRENHLNNSVECDDDTLPLKKSMSSSLIASAEDLGKAVIDVQLKEQIKRNCVLNDKLEVISKDKKDVEEKLKKTRAENEQLLSKVQTCTVFEDKFVESQKRLQDEINTVQELKDGYINLRSECQSKSDLIEMITNEKINLNNTLEGNKITIENLNKEVDMKCGEILTLTDRLVDVETKNSTLTEENCIAFDRLTNAHNDIKSLNDEISLCKAVIVDYEAQLDGKKSELCLSGEKLDALKRECQELQNAVNCYIAAQKQSEDDNFALKTTIDTMLKEYMTSCIVNDEKFYDYEREISSKNGQLDELLLKCCQLEKNLSDCSVLCENLDQELQRKNCRLDHMSQANTTLEFKLEECQEMLASKINDILKLTEENVRFDDDKKVLVEKYDTLTNEYNMRNDFIDEITKERNSLYDSIEVYKTTVEGLNEDISMKSDQIVEVETKYSKVVEENGNISEQLINACNEVKISNNRVSSCEAVILDLEIQVKNVESELSDRDDELNVAKQDCLRLQNMVVSYEGQMSVKSKDFEELLLNSHRLETKLSDLNKDLQKTNCDLGVLSHTNAELESKLNGCEEVLNLKAKEVEKLTEENVSIKKDSGVCIENYQLLIDDVKRERDDLRDSIESYKSDAEELSKEISLKDNLIAEFSDKVNNAECKHSEVVKENSRLLERLKETIDEVSKNKIAIDCFEIQIKHLSAENVLLSGKLKEREESLVLKVDEILKLVEDNATFKSDNDALVEKYEALCDDYKMKNDSIEEIKREKNNLQDEIERYKIAADELSKDISSKVDLVSKLTDELEKVECKYSTVVKENNRQSEKLVNEINKVSLSETVVQDCEARMKSVKSELSDRDNELEIARQDCLQLRNTVALCEERISLKVKEMEELSSNSEQVERQLEDLKVDLQDKNCNLDVLSQTIITLETKLEEFDEIFAVDEVTCKNQDGNVLIGKAVMLINRYKMQNDAMKQIELEKNNLHDEVEGYKMAVEDLNKQICTKCDLIVEVGDKLVEFESRNSELVVENCELSEKMVNACNEVKSLSEELSVTKQDGEVQIENANSELFDKNNELEAAKRSVLLYEEQLTTKCKELEESLSNSHQSEKHLSDCRLECENLNKTLQEISCNLDVLSRAKIELESKLNGCEEVLNLKTEEVVRLTEEKISIKNDSNIVVEKFETLIKDVKKERDVLQNGIESYKVVIEGLNKEIRLKSDLIAELTDKLKHFECEHSEVVEENVILTEKLTNACNSVKTLTEEMSLSKTVVQDYEVQIKNVKCELSDRHNELEIVKQDCLRLENAVVLCEEQISVKTMQLKEYSTDCEKLENLNTCNLNAILQTNVALESKLKECEESLALKMDEISKLTEDKALSKNDNNILIERYETLINNIKKEKNDLQDSIDGCKVELNEEIRSKSELVAELTDKLNNVECKYSEVAKENNNLSEKLTATFNEVSENKTAIEHFEIKINALSTEIITLESKLKRYEEALTLKTEEISKLTEEKVSSKNECNTLIEKYETLIYDIKREKDDIQSGIESYKVTVEDLNKEICTKSDLIAELVKEKKNLSIAFNEVSENKTAMEHFEIKVKESSTEIIALGSKLKQCEEALVSKMEEISKLTKEKVSSKNDSNILIEKYETLINDIKREKDDVQSSIESYKVTVEDLNKEICTKSDLIAELVKEKKNLSIAFNEVSENKTAMEHFEIKVKESSTEIIALGSKLKQCEEALVSKMEEISKLTKEKVSSKNDSNILIEKYETLIYDIKKEKDDIQSSIESYKVAVEELNKEICSKSDSIAELVKEKKNLSITFNKVSENKTAVEHFEIKINALSTEIITLESKLKQYEEALTLKMEEISKLTEEKVSSKNDSYILIEKYETLIYDIKREKDDIQSSIESYKVAVEELNKEICTKSDLIAELVKEKKNLSITFNKVSENKTAVEHFEIKINALSTEIITLESKLKQYEEALTLKMEEISKLTEEKVSSKNDSNILIEKYETLIYDIKREKDDIQSSIESYKVAVEELNKEICTKSDLIVELVKEKKNLSITFNEVSENKTAIEHFEIKINALSTEIITLESKLKQNEEALTLKTEEISKLTEEKVSSKNDSNTLIEKYETLIHDIKREKDDIQSSIESYKVTVEDLNKEICTKSDLIAELVKEKKHLSSTFNNVPKSKIAIRADDVQNGESMENVFVQRKLTDDNKLLMSIDDNISFEVFESESSLRQLDNGCDAANDDADRISALIHSTEMIAKTCAQNVLEKDELILSLERQCDALSRQVEDLQKIDRDSGVTSTTSGGDIFNAVRRSLSKTLERCSRGTSDADSTTEIDLNAYLSSVDSTMMSLVDECDDLKCKLGRCEYDKEVEVKQKLSELTQSIKDDCSEFELELESVSKLRTTLKSKWQRLNQILNGINNEMFTSFRDEGALKKLDLCERKLKRHLTFVEDELIELDKRASAAAVTRWLYRRLDFNKLDFNNKIYSLSPVIDSVDRLINDVDTVTKECEEYLSVKCESVALYDRLHRITEKYSKLEEKSMQFESLNGRLKADNDELIGTNAELTDKLSALRSLFGEIESKNERLTAAKAAQDEDNVELRAKVETLTEKLNDINLKMYTENVKPLIDFDKMLQDNIKLRDELRCADSVRVEYASLKSAYGQIADENKKLKSSAERGDVNELVSDLRNEYEDKLNRMKQKMKQLYQEQISVYIDKQKEELTRSESLCKKYADKIKSYESHVNQLSSELWKVGEKLLMERNEKDWLKQRLKEYGSRQSLLFPSTSDITKSQMTKSSSVLKVFDDSVRDLIDERNWQSSTKKPNKAESGGLHMSDEEGEVFDNTYLTDLKDGVCEPRLPKTVTAERKPAFDPNRLSELQWRNSLCLPHLKSSYPLELNLRKIKENDIKMGANSLDDSIVADKSSRPKKEAGQTSYKKPGPPTPSKKGGRQSLQGNDSREPLREHNDNLSKKATTPSRIRSLFMGNNSQKQVAKDENTFGTPKGRRLSIFRKPR